MGSIGPVQLLAVEFGPDSKFEGRIVEELEILEGNGQIRVLDMLFVTKESDGNLFTLDYQAEDMGDTVAALLGIPRELLSGAESISPSLAGENAFGLTLGEIREIAERQEPGTSAAYILLEHVWATYLRAAIREAGGVPVAEGFLTEEALEPVAVELAAAALRLGEPPAPPTAPNRKARDSRRS
ncbi:MULTISPECIES: hypothetical protein [Streptomyces]|uniref:DUF1269 domain-containing family protein n=2 Tax=Streptomyces TaxID=1883 RepID=A0A0W7X5S6_9ACTN|nr:MULTISPECIES: hypothetical protein [Streptomyces]KUF18262.1 hypothetical protein AT728_25190 [Streptomyces silvensis]MVO88146.1 DUF1269 domain-containing protein [Streptomyces typhae]